MTSLKVYESEKTKCEATWFLRGRYLSMCMRLRASELNLIEKISGVFANDSVILAMTVAQSLLVFTVVLPCNTSLETHRTGEADDDLRQTACSTEQRRLRGTPLPSKCLPDQVGA